MTISLQGHVHNTGGPSPPGKIAVTVVFGNAYCRDPVTFFIDESDADHWITGRMVYLTAYPLRLAGIDK